MFFGLSDATNAYEKAQDRRKETRKENARLYNEFIRLNPGATTQERLDYANKLIKDTGVGSAGLPTKAQMQSNYNKYRAAEAKKAAAEAQAKKDRERRLALENLTNSVKVGQALAGNYGDTNFEADLKKQFEALGIDESLLPNATNAAQTQAWGQWMTQNKGLIDAYVANPNQAALDALIAAGGATWTDKITGSYKPVLDRHLNELRLQSKIDIERLRGMTDKKAQDAQILILEQKYADIAAELDFKGIREDLDERERKRKEELGQTVSQKLQEIALTAKDEADFNARANAYLVTVAEDGEFKAEQGVALAALKERIELAEKEQAEKDQRGISVAVDQANDVIEKGVRAGQSAAEIEEIIEQQFSDINAEGRDIQISDADRARLEAAMTAAKDTLYARIEQSMNTQLSGENAAIALQQSKEEFLEEFKRTLTAEGVSNVDLFVNELGESYWAATEAKVRTAINDSEAKKVEGARAAMGDAGTASGVLRNATYDNGKMSEYADDVLKVIPAVNGVENENVAQQMLILKQQAMQELQRQAIGLQIPIDQDFANQYINQIATIATQATADGETYLNEDGTLPIDIMRTAFLNTFQLQGFGGEYAEIEAQAFNVALDNMGLQSMDDLMSGNVDMVEFQAEYRAAREQMRQANFDVLRGVTVEEDLQPATNVLERTDGLADRVLSTTKDSETLLNINPDEMVRIATLQGDAAGGSRSRDAVMFNEKIENLGLLEQELRSTQKQLEAEIARLSSLANSPVYTANHEGELDIIKKKGSQLQDQLAFVKLHLDSVTSSQDKIDAAYQQGEALIQKQREEAIKAAQAQSTPPLTQSQIAAKEAQAAIEAQDAAEAAAAAEAQRVAREQALAEQRAVEQSSASQALKITVDDGNALPTPEFYDERLNDLLTDETLNFYQPRSEGDLRYFKEDLIAMTEEGGVDLTMDQINGLVEAARRRVMGQ